MAKFTYTAKSRRNERVEGTIEGNSVSSAAQRLRSMGLFPVDILADSSGHSTAALEKVSLGKVRVCGLAEFTDQLANLFDSGVPLERALRVLEDQVSAPGLKCISAAIAESLCEGSSLAEALTAYPRVFTATYVNMVKVGEEAGTLPEMLKRLAKSLYDEHDLRSRIKAAMLYPVFLGCVGLGTVTVLVVYVIPKFHSFFASLESQLPLPTRLVIETSSILARVWPFLLAGGALAALFILRMLRNKNVRLTLSRLSVRMPLVGSLIRRSQAARLARTLGILLSHGVNILRAVAVTADTMSNAFIADKVRSAHRAIARGEKLYLSFSGSGLFPSALLQVMAIGQESGTLPQMLLKIADQYDKQTERQLKNFTTMLEPLMVLLVGAVVGFVVVSILMPIFRASALVQ